MALAFQPSEQSFAESFGDDYGATNAVLLHRRIKAQEKALAKTKRGTPAYRRISALIVKLRTQMPKPTKKVIKAAAPSAAPRPVPVASMSRSRPVASMSRSRPVANVPESVATPAVYAAEAIAEAVEAAPAAAEVLPVEHEHDHVEADEEHDLEVSATLDVDMAGDKPFYKRPVVWAVALGVVGLAYWKREFLRAKYHSMKGV